ncbi:putative Syn8 snare [Aureobasidium sp. EXF-3400]|nr:putative Syn8 snare [Aureobasidium sp. EXF-12344]KAI4776994.1 putative Syn8 snare [Aureobasidium sp. EXF-3400]
MSTSPHQLFLLADHIKLSLLERQRAVSLNLASNNDGPITRSLESLRAGLEALSAQAEEQGGDADSDIQTQLPKLRKQYEELSAQFNGHTPTTSTTTPNSSSLASDFAAVKATPTRNKSVRFDKPYRDSSPDSSRNALFNNSGTGSSQPYTDDEPTPDQSQLSNEQIHTYHKQVLSDQDAQLDQLSSSIGRQRLLGIQMGDEMDDQNAMLDDVESGVDRFQGNLDRARGRLGKVARKAKDNWSWVTIGVLILVLVLLLTILN